ncbi:toxin-antitoxin system YwqK family antitoxin [Niabella aquatica]
MARPYFLLLFILSVVCAKAQYYDGRVRIDSADRSYIFQVTDNDKATSRYGFYYWFKSGRIHRTQGSYYGKLLHGNYKVVDKERHLLEEGKFRNGKKVGLWRTWYENGVLRSTWRRRYLFFGNPYNVSEYDINGNIIKSGIETRGQFSGSQIEWVGDSSRIVRYKKGIAVNTDSTLSR